MVFTAGNIPTGTETVVVRREVPQTQAIDYIANDPFPAESHEEGLDRATMTIQQLQEEVNRSIKLSATNTMTSTEFTVGATDRANKVLAFDSSGEIAVTQELGTYKGTSATTTTAAYAIRDIVKGSTTAQLNNIYICIQASPIGTALTNTSYWVLIVDAVSAATSATAAASSATTAGNSATASANSATASANSATTSGNSATASGNSATAAASSATDAAASADAFDDIYLGTKSSDPSTDNDGDALAEGMLYFNSTSDSLRVYNGSAFQDAAVDTTSFLTLTGTQTLTNKTITSPKIGTKILDTGGNELALLTATSSAVNEFTVANAATNNAPRLSSTGGDSNVDLDILAKGTGHVTVRGNTNSGAIQLNCEANTHGQIIKAQPHSATVTNTMLLPAGASSTLVSLVSADTLTNKTLTSPKINEDVVVTSTATELNKLDGAGTLKQAGLETIWIPSSAMYGATTNPADAQQVETTAVRPDMKVLDFDAATDEFAQFSVAFPKSWNEGTVTYQVFWTPSSTNTGDCIFGLQGVSCGDSDTIDVAYGTAVTVTDAGIGTIEDQQVSSVSSAVTIAGSPAVDQQTYFQLYRDANAGGDTFSADARVLGIKIFYTTDAANDA